LGFGGTDEYYSIPQQVTIGNDVIIKQINSGSGNHFLAVACDGTVWGWGNNIFGQTGIGNTSVVNAPMQVLAGVLAGTYWDDGSGNLTNVLSVYGGNANSFAILDDGRVVSWGCNSNTHGQL